MEGCIKVNCGKLAATVVERYFVKSMTAVDTPNKDEVVILEVDPMSSWPGGRADVRVEGGNDVEPSFDYWQPDSPFGGNVELKLDNVTNGKSVNNSDVKRSGLPDYEMKEFDEMLASGET